MALLTAQLAGIEKRLDRIEALPRLWLLALLVVGLALLVAQIGTPFLSAALISR
jgi:hypothetical protein